MVHLNWREIAALTGLYRERVIGTFVDRIIIPERVRFPQGYIKGEWAIRLTSRKSESVLQFSVRPQHPSLVLIEGKGPKASMKATHSVFDLALSKHLRGAKVADMITLPRERVVLLWFVSEKNRLGLVLSLIPAAPEAFLIQEKPETPWPILARSRNVKTDVGYTPPGGRNVPENLEVRREILADAETWRKAVETELEQEALNLRKLALGKILRDGFKQATQRVKQSSTSAKEAHAEPDWQEMGDLLKAQLGNPPPLLSRKDAGRETFYRRVSDFESNGAVELSCDPKLGPQAQVEKFYQMSKRKNRRLEEAGSRQATFSETLKKFETALKHLGEASTWPELEKLERETGTAAVAPTVSKETKKTGMWLGKVFISQEGLQIWVGRSRDENLELTFKHARGNDVWMHVRGRPGAHVLIPLRSAKSASLETLLDAAVLAVWYSGGEKWGKTEVDYTFKKHVKRIKDSSEASYTGNKTLIVEPDQKRLQRLLK